MRPSIRLLTSLALAATTLSAFAQGSPLKLGVGGRSAFHPQRRFLSLLSTADGKAIASWGRWSASARWVWRWKDHIDRAFLERFSSAASPALLHPGSPHKEISR